MRALEIADAGPDSWGRRVIERRLRLEGGGLSTLGYLLESGSNRIGGIDLQHDPDTYVPRRGEEAAALVDHQIDTIRSNWHAACDHAELTRAERSALWGRQFLNPYTLIGHARSSHLAAQPPADPLSRAQPAANDPSTEHGHT